LATDNVETISLKVEDDSTFLNGYDVSVSRERMAALHFDSALVNIYDANGAVLETFAQVTDSYDYTGQGRIQISPTNESHVAWLFGSRFSSVQGVVVLDTDRSRFLEAFDDRDFDTFAFLPNGDVL